MQHRIWIAGVLVIVLGCAGTQGKAPAQGADADRWNQVRDRARSRDCQTKALRRWRLLTDGVGFALHQAVEFGNLEKIKSRRSQTA